MTAVLLIAHGSRRPEANADLVHVAGELARTGSYGLIQVSYLELAEPTIADGAAICVAGGATAVVMLPYFLSPGVHVLEDLTAIRTELCERYPNVRFLLAEPLGRHPLLIDVVRQRVDEATKKTPGPSPRGS
jgi:sirohydrochlorin ferrochelatase